jgi:hypothetical protein
MRSGRSWPSSRRERANPRARRRLEEAPSEPCPHCGRVTKTVDGFCADCWGVKDAARAARWRHPPRRESFLGAEWNPVTLLLAVGAAVLVFLAFIYALSRWI